MTLTLYKKSTGVRPPTPILNCSKAIQSFEQHEWQARLQEETALDARLEALEPRVHFT